MAEEESLQYWMNNKFWAVRFDNWSSFSGTYHKAQVGTLQ